MSLSSKCPEYQEDRDHCFTEVTDKYTEKCINSEFKLNNIDCTTSHSVEVALFGI